MTSTAAPLKVGAPDRGRAETDNAMLHGRRILLIISGGIAAYKSLDLIRRLRERGAVVRTIMTEGAQRFITPLAASALSGDKVYTDLFSLTDDGKTAAKEREGERAPWEQVGEDFTPAQVGLRDLVFQIGAAARQVVVAGTPEQASRAEALLKETRRGLYRILAEDEPESDADATDGDASTDADA